MQDVPSPPIKKPKTRNKDQRIDAHWLKNTKMKPNQYTKIIPKNEGELPKKNKNNGRK